MKLAIPVTHGHSAGNVPDEWVFNCKRSARDFILSPNRTKNGPNVGLPIKIFQKYFFDLRILIAAVILSSTLG